VNILEIKWDKFEDNTFPCIMLGVSEKSKGYHIFNPMAKRIVVSKDVVLEKEKWFRLGAKL